MYLPDVAIMRRLEKGDLVIDPLLDPAQQIQPASVDIRLGNEFLEFNRTNISCIHPEKGDEIDQYVTETVVGDGEEFILHPGDFILGTTAEHVEIPADLVAKVEGRSSLGRLAIIVHATAGFIDPGYQGQVTLEMSNLGVAPVALTPGMRVGQLAFTEMHEPSERPYGEERGSKYQGQKGPQASRIQDDPEYDEHVETD